MINTFTIGYCKFFKQKAFHLNAISATFLVGFCGGGVDGGGGGGGGDGGGGGRGRGGGIKHCFFHHLLRHMIQRAHAQLL